MADSALARQCLPASPPSAMNLASVLRCPNWLSSALNEARPFYRNVTIDPQAGEGKRRPSQDV